MQLQVHGRVHVHVHVCGVFVHVCVCVCVSRMDVCALGSLYDDGVGGLVVFHVNQSLRRHRLCCTAVLLIGAQGSAIRPQPSLMHSQACVSVCGCVLECRRAHVWQCVIEMIGLVAMVSPAVS